MFTINYEADTCYNSIQMYNKYTPKFVSILYAERTFNYLYVGITCALSIVKSDNKKGETL